MTNEQTLVLRRVLKATCEEVFAAWTDPASIKVWMCLRPGMTLPIVEIDLRVGGSFRIAMQDDQGTVVNTGTYLEITPPSRLVFTWRSSITHERDTLVTLEVHKHPLGAELVLTHTAFPDQQSLERHQNGWNAILSELAGWLAA